MRRLYGGGFQRADPCSPLGAWRLWTPRVRNDAPLGYVPSPGATLSSKFASSPLKRTRNQRLLRRRRVSALVSQQASGNQMRTHTRPHTRDTHTPSPEAPPVRTFRASDAALRRGNPRAGARWASRASPVHRSHHSRAFPRTWCHPGTSTLSRGAQLCTRQRSLLVQAPSTPQKDRPAHSFLPGILFKPRKAKPFPTCDENFFLLPQRNKAGDLGGRCG